MSWLDQLAEIRKTDWNEASEGERDDKSKDVILISAYAGAAASVVPVPMAELALLLPIHTAMVMTVGHVQGRSVSRAEAARVAMELGAVAGLTFAGTAALSVLRKIVLPGIGGVLAAPASFALSYGLGRVAMAYFKDPALSREELRAVFKDAFSEGKSTFSKEQFDRWRKRHGEGRTVVEEAQGDADRSSAAQPAADGSSDFASSGSSASPGEGAPPVRAEPVDRSQTTADGGEGEAIDVEATLEPDSQADADSEGPEDPTLRPRKRSL